MPSSTDILLLEDQLTRAERTGDQGLLDRLLSPDFLGVTLRGKRVDKAAFIAAFCSSGLTFPTLTIENLFVGLEQGFATVIGRSIFVVKTPAGEFSGSAQFLDLWVLADGHWSLLRSSVSPEA